MNQTGTNPGKIFGLGQAERLLLYGILLLAWWAFQAIQVRLAEIDSDIVELMIDMERIQTRCDMRDAALPIVPLPEPFEPPEPID